MLNQQRKVKKRKGYYHGKGKMGGLFLFFVRMKIDSRNHIILTYVYSSVVG